MIVLCTTFLSFQRLILLVPLCGYGLIDRRIRVPNRGKFIGQCQSVRSQQIRIIFGRHVCVLNRLTFLGLGLFLERLMVVRIIPELHLVDSALRHHGQVEEDLGVHLLLRVLVVEQDLVIQAAVHLVARVADHVEVIVEFGLLLLLFIERFVELDVGIIFTHHVCAGLSFFKFVEKDSDLVAVLEVGEAETCKMLVVFDVILNVLLLKSVKEIWHRRVGRGYLHLLLMNSNVLGPPFTKESDQMEQEQNYDCDAHNLLRRCHFIPFDVVMRESNLILRLNRVNLVVKHLLVRVAPKLQEKCHQWDPTYDFKGIEGHNFTVHRRPSEMSC